MGASGCEGVADGAGGLDGVGEAGEESVNQW